MRAPETPNEAESEKHEVPSDSEVTTVPMSRLRRVLVWYL